MDRLTASVPDGEELTARAEEEHQQISSDPGAGGKMQDIRDEEDLLPSRLQDTMDTGRVRTLGTTWATARLTAPTHPHPVIPGGLPGTPCWV
ncbi:hypothetical protein BFF78_37325 [Streptomyces fodineus]|uniref:Uncharacterized protein n=2 Tax=Streptomyces fodineus TaxID=1904616 RepID=A0A1D7YK47_9ACTN|nr:hypothetical protein BFF78_37325 [Streptomyces fodineus]